MITQAYLKECFDYDPNTGVAVWRTRPLGHFKSLRVRNRWNGRRAGRVVGCKTKGAGKLEYRLAGIDDKLYKLHRLVFLHQTGKWPQGVIDHENGDGLDNRMANLRDVTNQENTRNASLRTNNTTGIVGVAPMTNSDRFVAYIKVDGKKKHLGCFRTIEEAAACRAAADVKYGFHPNHGRAA